MWGVHSHGFVPSAGGCLLFSLPSWLYRHEVFCRILHICKWFSLFSEIHCSSVDLCHLLFLFFFHARNLLGGGYCLVLVDLLFLFILCQLCTFVFGCHFYLFQLSMLMTQAHLMLQLLRVSWMHLLFSLYAEKPTSWNEMWAAAWEDEKKKSQKPFYCNGMDLSGPWSTICSSCTFWQKSEGFLTKR